MPRNRALARTAIMHENLRRPLNHTLQVNAAIGYFSVLLAAIAAAITVRI
jgi:hypothetical protein